MKQIIILLLSLTLILGSVACLSGCDMGPIATSDNNGTTIVVTCPAAHALVQALTAKYTEDGGTGIVTVVPMYKIGQDAHGFEPTAKDTVELSNADVVVCTGAETWLDAALKSSGNTAVRMVAMMAACDTVEAEHDHDACEDSHAHDQGGSGILNQDEHVWLSVENAICITKSISTALRLVDEENAAIWQQHEEAVCNELTVLKNEYRDMMKNAVRNTVVVADRHPFTYLFHELGLNCIAAFPGCSSETSATFETQTMLIQAVESNEIPYIFMIEGSDGSVAEVVSKSTGAEILTLNSLQIISSYENISYVEIMRSNLENLKKALQ